MKMGRFEKIAILTMAVLVLVLAILALASYQIGLPEPQVVFPSESGLIGGRGPVEVRFQQEMDRLSVENRLSFEPAWQGKWRWLDDRTLRFFPNTTLGEGTRLKLVVAEGARSRDGRVLRQPFEVDLSIRPASLVFLGDPLYSPELLRLNPLSGESQSITASAGRVFDFAVSPDGEKIIYSRINLRDGSDLVLINRDGSGEKVLVECGDFACIEPAWTTDGRFVAYTRYESGLTASLIEGIGNIYIVDVESGLSNLLFNNPGLYGSLAVFSPDGSSVSFYDFGEQAIRLVNLQDGSSSIIPSRVAGRGSWSPDGGTLIVADWDGEGTIPTSTLFRLDLQTRSVSRFFDDSFEVLGVSLPEWSPDGDLVVCGVQTQSAQEGKQLWLFDRNGKPVMQITNDPQMNYSSYQWSPDGQRLVFQQINLSQSNDTPKILMWYRADQKVETLFENGAFPQWMP
jgi:TolB protein